MKEKAYLTLQYNKTMNIPQRMFAFTPDGNLKLNKIREDNI